MNEYRLRAIGVSVAAYTMFDFLVAHSRIIPDIYKSSVSMIGALMIIAALWHYGGDYYE